jgi:hypothetical protein
VYLENGLTHDIEIAKIQASETVAQGTLASGQLVKAGLKLLPNPSSIDKTGETEPFLQR